ncbi:MAG: YsnF/AvaK domain-containing protein [Janthinobacterium lividum]
MRNQEDELTLGPDQRTIPLIAEHLDVTTHLRQTGVVRLQKVVEERTETVEVPLTSRVWDVKHVPVDRVVEEVPDVRQVGDTTIYPVMEERLVVVRQLVLKEEVHVTRATTMHSETTTQTLRYEVLQASREPA